MTPTSNSAWVWRCIVVLVTAMAVTQFAIELFHAPRVLQIGRAGEPLVTDHILRERGPTTFIVDSIPAGSPLKEAGVAPGDRLRWDAPVGRWYNVAAGERLALTVMHGEESRRIEVTMPAARSLPRYQLASYVLGAAATLVALLIGALIGWRRPDLTAYRALAIAGLLQAFQFPYSAPESAHVAALDFVASVSSGLVMGAIVFFAINYPDGKPIGWRAVMKRIYPWLFGVLVVANVIHFVRLYEGQFEPAAGWISRTYSVALPILFFWTLLLAWRQARGELRVRLQWILATVGTIVGLVLIGTLNRLAETPVPVEVVDLLQSGGSLAGTLGFSYAVLRHRIFDFGLAVNRTLVFAIIGVILLTLFQVVHAIIGELLHFSDKVQTILFGTIVAFAIHFSYGRLKKRVERFVDWMFFKGWAIREEGLQQFVAVAKHASDPDALSQLLVTALDRYTRGAGCAVFQRDANNVYLRATATLAGAPTQLGANDETVLAMRTDGKVFHIGDESPARPAVLALPMAHRGELFGFVLIGPTLDGEPYRTDQIDLLKLVAHEVGLDFYALTLEQLTKRIEDERRTAETLRAQLQTAIAMSRTDYVVRAD